MAVASEVIAGILVVVLLATWCFALLVGILGGVFGEGFGRCARCGHVAIFIRGQAHPTGCPETLHQRFGHLMDAAFGGVHLRHH